MPQGEMFDFFEQPHEISLNNLINLFSDFVNGQVTRENVLASLIEQFPYVADFYHEEIGKTGIVERKVTVEFQENLVRLQQLIYQDFMQTKQCDFINVVLEHRLSPISAIRISEIKTESNVAQIQAATTIQRYFRSYLRKKLHLTLFKQPPQVTLPNPHIIRNNPRLLSIITQLSQHYAAVNNIQYHWTTLGNFYNIIRNHSFYGNQLLKPNGIYFQPNALSQGDIKNGDGAVICFCPYLVDHQVIYDFHFRQFKKNLIRLSINLDHIQTQGEFNQFFKLRDLKSPNFMYDFRVNADLAFTIICDNSYFFVEILLKENKERIVVYEILENAEEINQGKDERHHSMLYGNLYAINRFCLLQLFTLLEKCNNLVFKQEIFNYLISLEDVEIKKILVIFAQSFSVFAEYNFNSVLKLQDLLISEIHFVARNTTYMFNHLTEPRDYRKIMDAMQCGEFNLADLPSRKEQLISFSMTKPSFRFYGHTGCLTKRCVYLKPKDFSHWDANDFANQHYIETRDYPQDTPDFSLNMKKY